MLSTLRKTKESGFTLIELLTVIIIIGILAAIAIPVFSAQRSRAQDSQTVSDVRNIVTAAETFLADRTKTPASITDKSVLEYVSAKNVQWEIKGNNTTNGYCIVAFNSSGKDYNSSSKLLSYDSTAGGLKGSNGSCGPKDSNGNVTAGAPRTDTGFTSVSTPAATNLGSTAVGSSTATPIDTTPVNYVNNSTGRNGNQQVFTVPATGTYKIETWGAQGGSGAWSGQTGAGGLGAYASGTFALTAGQSLSVIVGQMGTNDGGSNPSVGGGGASAVTTGSLSPSATLVVAGGGGGTALYAGYVGSPGSVTTGANTANTSGAAGAPAVGNGGNQNSGGGGGSLTATGGNGCYSNSGGGSLHILYGGVGSNGNAHGGFGFGAGGGGGCNGTGGGGGYTGGSGAGGGGNSSAAQGGGSYVASLTTTTAVTNNTDKANSGHGKVTITRIS